MRGKSQITKVLIGIITACLWVGCAAPLIPQPEEPRRTREEASDANIIASLQQNWKILGKVSIPKDKRQQALAEYNADMLTLIQRLRLDSHKARKKGSVFSSELFDVYINGRKITDDLYQLGGDVVPAEEIEPDELKERITIAGLGVPLVRIMPMSQGTVLPGMVKFKHHGTVSSITALMEFPQQSNTRPRLHFLKRLSHETFRIKRLEYTLSADFSAAIEMYWALTHIKKNRWLGMLYPQELRDVTGLVCMEEYDPHKIPIILTHGIMSEASTFDNLVNRLMAEPEIRKSYQFWYFNYPTGVAWTISSAAYRRSLKAIRQQLDPQKRNKNWDNMVVIGHSMGGLITRYSQSVEPWKILENGVQTKNLGLKRFLDEKYIQTPIPDQRLEAFRAQYFFRPLKAGMVIYLATPHRGAPMAKYRIVNVLMSMVKLPQQLINIATLQQDNVLMNPRQLTTWFTSGKQLAPDSYSIKGLNRLAVRAVPTHSIIGDRGRGNTPRSSDGVVPYWSSHISWGTETIVPADHSVQDVPETAHRLCELLRAYAKKNPPVKQKM